MGSMGSGRDERNVIRAGTASGVKSCGFIKHSIIPPPSLEYKGSETEAVWEIRRQHPAAHMELLQ